MRLTSVTIKNFRAFKDELTIAIGDLTAVIGKNDAGKSSVLEALEIFFNNDTVTIDQSDKSVHTTDEFIEVTCDFADLPESLVLDENSQTTLQSEYLLAEDGLLRIRKRWTGAAARPKEEIYVCAYHPSSENYADLLFLTQAKLRERMQQLGVPNDSVNRNSNPEMRKAIWAHCPSLVLTTQEIAVAKEDGKRIWDLLKVHLPLFALFQSDRPSRDSDSEVQDPMKLAIAEALAQEDVVRKLAEVVDAVRSHAVALAERTHDTLSKLDANLARELCPEFKAEPRWASLFTLELKCDNGIAVNKRGSGVRRLILVSFFRAEAERRLAAGTSRSIIYAIEEPETAQHPHNQRILLDSLQQLASESGAQVLITTHSPGLASYLPVDSFRFIDTLVTGRRSVLSGSDPVLDRIAESLGVVPDNRVRALLCVEGPHDVTALSCLSRALHADDPSIPDLTSDPRVAFITLGGSTLMQWVNDHRLKELRRPEVHIYDNDVSSYQDAINAVNARGDGSWGELTRKREIENYLHPDAIFEGLGVRLSFGDTDDVPGMFMPRRNLNSKKAKRRLADRAFPLMTASRIMSRDPEGEVVGWFRRLAETISR